MFYLLLLAFLILPPAIVGFWAWLEASTKVALWLIPTLVPAIWALIIVVRIFSEPRYDPGPVEILGPVILGGIALVALWSIWYSKDPKDAGLFLAGVEGTVAVAQVRDGHPVLGTVTGVGAVAQASESLRSDTEDVDGRADGTSLLDLIKGKPDPRYYVNVGMNYSFDWCRYRGFQHCWFSGLLNQEASKSAGYAVSEPVDRGRCLHQSWDEQEQCPVAEPGPNAARNGAEGFLEAWIPWEAGGQRPSPSAAAKAYVPKPASHPPVGTFDRVGGPSALRQDDLARVRGRAIDGDGALPVVASKEEDVDPVAPVEPAPVAQQNLSVTEDPEVLAQVDRLKEQAARAIADSLTGKGRALAPTTPSKDTSSVADEIGKLAALRDAGDLTADEYEDLKARLIREGD